MNARYARGRTALVRRRKWFHGPKTVRWAFLALCFANFSVFIRTKRVSPDFEPALVGHSWAQTDTARYLPTGRAPKASLIGLERTGVA